jgi:glyoxylase-like metal-dependent hydrolase (beta-lactamase superfamily II)
MRAVCRLLPLAFFLLLAAPGAAAEEVAGLPLHVQRLNPKAVRVWVGDHVSTTNVVAFSTTKGIVVVDTTGIPKIDRELRRVIAHELGRSDFTMLINTHEHGDHTGGNSAYSDLTIVAHERCAAGMQRDPAHRTRSLEWQATRIAELERDLAKQTAGSPEARRKNEELTLARLNQEVLKADEKPVLPATTFVERMTLDLGDTTFELSWIGGLHTASDIAVFVPGQGLLLTGDVMADKWLTDTPGCLASFMAREGVPHDFPLFLENGRRLLAQKDRITTLLPGHWNGELSFGGFEARIRYIETLWDGIRKDVKEGKGITDVHAAYRLDKRFPDLATSPGLNPRNNATTIAEIWKVVTNQRSAAAELYALFEAGSPEEAIRKVLAERDAKAPKYYFVEGEINGHGYRFLQEEKTAKAVSLFRINAELYPESWNVFDSLGEALLKSGDADGAKRMYEKSVALNPENRNGKEALEGLRARATAK